MIGLTLIMFISYHVSIQLYIISYFYYIMTIKQAPIVITLNECG